LDRNDVITGGTGALGTAVTARLLEAGAMSHIPCVETEAPRHIALADHERVRLAFEVDLSSEASVGSYFQSVDSLWASVHLAGGFSMAALTETSLEDFDRMVTLNGVTCFLSCREAVRAMRAGGTGGRIVNVAARPAVQPVAGMTAYAASKAMVASLTQSLAEELEDDGILVNAILPSIIDTPANRAAMPKADHARWPTAAQIAETIAFLVSPANALTSGALVPVFGRA
jgi:NAD(P)-dependent dehydrogenase (short-subunit alcohol dehydrogenase family)